LRKRDIKRLKRAKPIFPKITYERAIEILNLPFGSDICFKDEKNWWKSLKTNPFLSLTIKIRFTIMEKKSKLKNSST